MLAVEPRFTLSRWQCALRAHVLVYATLIVDLHAKQITFIVNILNIMAASYYFGYGRHLLFML